MLVTLRRKLPVDLDADELRTVLMAASSDEWRPAVLDQQRYFLSLAGIGDSVDPDDFTATRSHSPRSRSEVAGDVFFKDGFILYVTLGDVGRIVRNEYGHLVRFLKRGEEKLEIGVIGEDEENAISKLDEFSDLIVDAIKYSLDGRKTRHIDFNWVKVEPSRTRIEDIVESSKDETGLEFRPLNLMMI